MGAGSFGRLRNRHPKNQAFRPSASSRSIPPRHEAGFTPLRNASGGAPILCRKTRRGLRVCHCKLAGVGTCAHTLYPCRSCFEFAMSSSSFSSLRLFSCAHSFWRTSLSFSRAFTFSIASRIFSRFCSVSI